MTGTDEGTSERPARSGRLLVEEVLVVLSLSLLASAVFSLIDMFTTPLRGGRAILYAPAPFAAQLAQIVFALAPVGLVWHLARRSGEPLADFGLGTRTLRADLGWGAVLGVGVALVGYGLYVGAVRLGVNRFVDPAPPAGHWWTWPILVLGAVQAGLLEEVVVVGYLIRRLGQIGWGAPAAVAASALLRGSYHLYQGWGGFVGNALMGLVFASAFVRWRRTWPLIAAHALIDLLAGAGYLIVHGKVPGVS